MTHKHRPKISRVREETAQGEALIYRLTCGCGLREDHFVKREADQARRGHQVAVTPPPEQQCQRPKDHGSRRWDECVLCADQPALFDAGEVA